MAKFQSSCVGTDGLSSSRTQSTSQMPQATVAPPDAQKARSNVVRSSKSTDHATIRYRARIPKSRWANHTHLAHSACVTGASTQQSAAAQVTLVLSLHVARLWREARAPMVTEDKSRHV